MAIQYTNRHCSGFVVVSSEPGLMVSCSSTLPALKAASGLSSKFWHLCIQGVAILHSFIILSGWFPVTFAGYCDFFFV